MIETIIIVNDFAEIKGGADKIAIETAIMLTKVIPHVILFSTCGPINHELQKSSVKIICLDQVDILRNTKIKASIQGIWNMSAKSKFDELLKKTSNKNTIIHFHSWTKAISPSLFYSALKYKFKIVYTLHDYFFYCPNGGYYNFNTSSTCKLKALSRKCLITNCDSRSYSHKVWRSIRQAVFNFVTRKYNQIDIITISKLNNKIAIQNKKTNHILHFIPNTIQMASLNTKDMNDTSERIHYAFIGRMSKEKGIDLFCQACSELGYPAIVIGNCSNIDSYIKKYPEIQFTGWKKYNEIKEYLKTIKALVFPSHWYEAAPLTTKEIASYGIPLIVSNICAAEEDVLDGENGYLFESGNIESLKKAMLKLNNSNWEIMNKKALEVFDRRKYSEETYIHNLIELYGKILTCKSN